MENHEISASGRETKTWTQSVDLIASSTLRCNLGKEIELTDYVLPEAGYCVAVRALHEKERYNEVECSDGVFRTIRKGDILVGVLGSRRALEGYCGEVPRQLNVGDVMNVLNLGGIIGRCTSELPALGPSLRVEILGAVLDPHARSARHACIRDSAISPSDMLTDAPPLVVVSGTAMNTGKTTAACRIVEGLSERGMTVDAAKLTGASLMRDVRRMRDHGARHCLTFTDTGIVSTTDQAMRPYAKGIIKELAAASPDVIVLELGDGLIGYYGVDELLRDQQIQRFTHSHVLAATDLTGVWAAQRLFRERYGSSLTVVTGPVTDHGAGKEFIECEIGVPALNANKDAGALADAVAHALKNAAASSHLSTLSRT